MLSEHKRNLLRRYVRRHVRLNKDCSVKKALALGLEKMNARYNNGYRIVPVEFVDWLKMINVVNP